MGITNFPYGVSSFGMPVMPAPYHTVGKVVFCCSLNGSASYSGARPEKPVNSIANALLKCTATSSAYPKNDMIICLPGHAEAPTAAITINVAGVIVRGLGTGSQRPTITGGGAIDAVNITAAGVIFDNFVFGAPTVDSQTAMINVAGVSNVTIRNIFGIGSAGSENIVDCITAAASSHYLTIENVYLYNITVAVNSFLSLEGASSHVTVRNFYAYGLVATGGIIDGALITNLLLENVAVCVTGSTKPAITLDSNPTGIARWVHAKGTDTTIANNCALGNALALFEVRVLEEYSVQGGIIPAQDTE